MGNDIEGVGMMDISHSINEGWINVYAGYGIANLHGSREEAEQNYINYGGGPRPLYRIHVKMKPVKPKFDPNFIEFANKYIADDEASYIEGNKNLSLSSLIDDNSFKNRDLLRRAEDRFGVLDYH